MYLYVNYWIMSKFSFYWCKCVGESISNTHPKYVYLIEFKRCPTTIQLKILLIDKIYESAKLKLISNNKDKLTKRKLFNVIYYSKQYIVTYVISVELEIA